MSVKKRPWVFVCICVVSVCGGVHVFEFGRVHPSVDGPARDLV